MNKRLMVSLLGVPGILMMLYSALSSEPSFNGSTPGCSGGSCHSLSEGKVTAVVNGLDVQISVSGTSSSVGGELVNQDGNVVASINSTRTNPFVLTAPQAGSYIVNAGYKNPSPRIWDSLRVDITLSAIDPPGPAATPETFVLYPNHPNPFNGETAIRFSLPDAGEVSVAVFNLKGQLVKHLAEGYFYAGTHALRWDGRDDVGNNSASGSYFLVIRNGRERLVRQMILSK